MAHWGLIGLNYPVQPFAQSFLFVWHGFMPWTNENSQNNSPHFFLENRENKVRSERKFFFFVFFFHLTVSPPPSFQTFFVSFFIVAYIKIFLHLIRRGLFIYTCSAVSQISLWASRGMKALFNQYLLPQPSVPWAWNNSHFLRYYLFHFALSFIWIILFLFFKFYSFHSLGKFTLLCSGSLWLTPPLDVRFY